MRAPVTRARGSREVIDVGKPAGPGPDEVFLAPEALGLCGSDFHYYLGDIGTIDDPSALAADDRRPPTRPDGTRARSGGRTGGRRRAFERACTDSRWRPAVQGDRCARRELLRLERVRRSRRSRREAAGRAALVTHEFTRTGARGDRLRDGAPDGGHESSCAARRALDSALALGRSARRQPDRRHVHEARRGCRHEAPGLVPDPTRAHGRPRGVAGGVSSCSLPRRPRASHGCRACDRRRIARPA